jgi:hypothetical protein
MVDLAHAREVAAAVIDLETKLRSCDFAEPPGRPPPNPGGYGPFQPYACQAPNGGLSGNLWITFRKSLKLWTSGRALPVLMPADLGVLWAVPRRIGWSHSQGVR